MLLNMNKRSQVVTSILLASNCMSSVVLAEQFTLIALPDTQFYSRYREASQYLNYDNPYLTQMKWIRDKSAERNIRFTMHLGDIVDQATVNEEWVFASQAHAILDDAGISYGVARGNHDVIPQSAANPPAAPFTDWFGPSRFAGMPTYRSSSPDGVNSYHVFEGGGREFGVLFTDWRNNQADLDWARSVLQANASKPTILISHEILGPNFADPSNPNTTAHGQLLFDELIAGHNQIFMTISGHNQGTGWKIVENNFGNEVLQHFADFQFCPFNGAGYLRELNFDTEANTISARTFSPWLEQVRDLGIVIPPFFNVPTELTSPQAQFTWAVNFDDRFGVIPEPAAMVLIAEVFAAGARRRA